MNLVIELEAKTHAPSLALICGSYTGPHHHHHYHRATCRDESETIARDVAGYGTNGNFAYLHFTTTVTKINWRIRVLQSTSRDALNMSVVCICRLNAMYDNIGLFVERECKR